MPNDNENYINREGILPPLTEVDIDDWGNPIPDKSAAETWRDALARNSGIGQGISNIPLSSVYIGERYGKGTIPGMDYEEAAARNQSRMSKFTRGLGKFGVLTTTTFLENTVGAVNGLIKSMITGKVSSFYNNDFNRWIDDVNSKMEDRWAHYYTQAERDARWFSPKKWFTANFLWDKILKNLGFSAGTIAAGYVYGAGLSALSKALKSMSVGSKLFSVGRGAEVLATTEKALRGASAAGKSSNVLRSVSSLAEKEAASIKVGDIARKITIAGLATSGESSIEAYHNLNEYRDNRIEEYKLDHGGMSPTGADLEMINRDAERVGNWSYIFNVGILTFTNYVQFPKLLGSSFGTKKAIAGSRNIGRIAKEGGKYVIPKRNRILATIKNVTPYTFSATESFEEGAQYAVTKGTEYYYNLKSNDLPVDFLTSVMRGVSSTIGTDEGMENVLIGGLSGAIMLGPGKFIERRKERLNTERAVADVARGEGPATINTAGFSDFTKETFDSVNRSVSIDQMLDDQVIEDDVLNSKDLLADYIINYVFPRVKFGRFDLVKSDIEDYRNIASTENGFEGLQQQGIASKEDTREAFLDRLNRFEKVANDVNSLYDAFYLKYSTLKNDKGENLYSPQVIEKMVYAASKISDYDRRISELSFSLSPYVSVLSIGEDLLNGNAESFNEAVKSIKSAKIVNKDDVGRDLDDYAELVLRRDKLFKEYIDIKDNPENYRISEKEEETKDFTERPTVEEAKAKKTVETIRIKTKKGEKDIEIGTEYYLGRRVEYDEEGNKIDRFARISILGKNEDGKIRIRTSDGEILNVSEEKLEDYNLGKVSTVKNNPEAKFYIDNSDRVITRRLKNGKKQEGTLGFDTENNTLLFEYVTKKKGKIQKHSFPIELEKFEPQEGYEYGVYSTGRKLTKEDKQNIKDSKLSEEETKKARRTEVDRGITDQIPTVRGVTNENFEPSKKKSIHIIANSTTVPSNSNKPHHIRSNKFGFNFPKLRNRKNIRGIYVTIHNQDLILPGLIDRLATREDGTIDESIDKDQIIAMVMVDVRGDKPVLVNVNGNPLTKKQQENALDFAIYQTKPLASLRWSAEYGGESGFRKQDEDRADSIRSQYAKVREQIIEQSKEQGEDIGNAPVHTIENSFGHPEYHLDTDGNIDRETRTPVQDAGLIDNEDLETSYVIYVPTTNNVVERGTTIYEGNNKGRPFLWMPDGAIPLQNRKITNKEANVIFNVLHQLSKSEKINEEKNKELIEWLKSILYYGKPRVPHSNNVYIGKNNKGVDTLYISGMEICVFGPSSLSNNREDIVKKLQGIYNNVNVGIAKRSLNEQYKEIIDIDEEGNITYRTWSNYQSYLLSNIVEETGAKRTDVPLATAMKSTADSKGGVNRTGIYFYTTDNANEIEVPERPSTRKFAREVEEGEIVLDGKTANTINGPNGESIVFAATGIGEDQIRIGKGTDYNPIYNQVIEEWQEEGKIKKGALSIQLDKDIKKEVLKRLKQAVINRIEEQKEQTKPEVKKKKTKAKQPRSEAGIRFLKGKKGKKFSRDEDNPEDSFFVLYNEEDGVAQFEFRGDDTDAIAKRIFSEGICILSGSYRNALSVNTIKPGKIKRVGEEWEVIEPTEVELSNAPLDSVDKKVNEAFKEEEKEDTDEEMFRVAKERKVNTYETEDWTRLEKWLKEYFPNIPIYRVKNIIRSTNGKQLWGAFYKGAIYIYENAEIGTVYHEVFEAVWKTFSDSKERAAVIKEFRSRKGTFVDRETGKRISYSEAADHQIKEQLAEEFRDYVQYKKVPPKPNKGRPFIVKLFYDLVKFIKSIISEDSRYRIEEMFEKISTGYYRNMMPFESKLSLVNRGIIDITDITVGEEAEAREVRISDHQRREFIDSMIYYTVFDLIKNDENLFSFTTRGVSRSDLYGRVQNRLIKDISRQRRIEKVDLPEEEQNLIDQQSKILARNLLIEWDGIVSRFEEYLLKYNIQFDENDEVELKEGMYEKGKHDPFGSPNKIDHFRKSHSALKLLLSTMPKMDNNGVLMRSTVGGPILQYPREVVTTLYNHLHDSYNLDEMLYRLGQLADSDSNYLGLYKRLTGKEYKREYGEKGNCTSDLSKVNSKAGSRLLAVFYKTFKKQNPKSKRIVIFEDGDISFADNYLSSFASQIREDYISDIINKIKSGSKYFVYDKKNKVYVGNFSSVKNVVLNSIEARVKFLEDIGIHFNLKKLNSFLASSKEDLRIFSRAVDGIRYSIRNKEKIVTISRNVLDINNNLLDLSYIEAKIENPELDTTFNNLDGEKVVSFINNNPISDFSDFLNSIERLEKENLEGTSYEYLLSDIFSRGSSILKRMFASTGKKRETTEVEKLMTVVYVDGLEDMRKSRKIGLSKATKRVRDLVEFNINLKGYYYTIVPGDASLDWAIYMGNPVSESDIRSGMKAGRSIFKDYFISEVELSRDWKNRESSMAEVDNKKRNPKDLRFFKDILGTALHDKIVSNESDDASKIYSDNEKEINEAIDKYIAKKNKTLRSRLERYGLLKEEEDGYHFEDIDIKGTFTESALNTKLTFLNVNFIIANIEQHKLIFSDPYIYSDEIKRSKLFCSPKGKLINNSRSMNELFNKVYNKGLKKGDPGWTDFFRDHIRTVVLNDINSMIEGLEGYEDFYEESDGAALIFYNEYRKYRLKNGDWGDAEERQWEYDMAREREYFNSELLTEHEKEIIKQGNPQVTSAYTPLKAAVTGNTENGKSYNDIVIDKYALFPWSLRMLLDINKIGKRKRSNAVDLYKKMRDSDIGYAVFSTGRKVRESAKYDPYNEEGNIDPTPFKEEDIVNVPYSIIGEHSAVPSVQENNIPMGSQITKMATMDLMDCGVPIDYEAFSASGEKTDNITIRRKAWDKLTEEDKKKASPLYTMTKYNQNLLDTLTSIGYRRLLRKLGIKEIYNEDKGKKEYIIPDRSVTASLLRQQILRIGGNDNISSALDAFEEDRSILETTPVYKQLRNIIYSIVDREIISKRISGSMKVQMPSSFMEEKRVLKKTVNGKPVYTSDILKFYEEGKETVCEIMVSRWFNSPMSDEELLEYLKTEEGKKILSGVSFRIPTQKQFSIDRFVIKQFLPREFGDVVIVPSAIVRKAGSDFDIDKLFLYLKNIILSEGRYPQLISIMDDSNSTVEERYKRWVLDTVDKNTRDYVKFLQKDRVNEIKKKYKSEYDRLNREYSEFAEKLKYIAYKGLLESYDQIYLGATEQDVYLSDLFEEGRSIYSALSEGVKEEFQMLKEWIAENDLRGPEEIIQYLTLAQDMVDQHDYISDEKILNDLISNYKQELEAIGATKEQIAKAKEYALFEFREEKDKALEGLSELIIEKKKNVSLLKRGEIDSGYINELVREADLISLDEFKKLSVLEQNTKRAVENGYIQSLEDLVSHPMYFKNLIDPNTSKDMKDLSERIKEKKGEEPFDYSKVSNLIDREFMSDIRYAFLSGKRAISISASNQGSMSLFQKALVYIDPSMAGVLSKDDKEYLGDCSIKLPGANTTYVDGKGRVTVLSMNEDSNKNFISDTNSQMINGYVDVTAGAWASELGAGYELSPIWFFLLKCGVPRNTIGVFMNQPIIRDYMTAINNSGYKSKFIKSIIDDIEDVYKSTKDATNMPSTNRMESMLSLTAESMNTDQKASQILILREFLKYARLSEHYFYVSQGINFDTFNLIDPSLLFKKIKQLEKARNTVIGGVDSILKNSFLSRLMYSLYDARNATSSIITSDSMKIRTEIENGILDKYTDSTDREFVRISKKVTDSLFDYYVQTARDINKAINKILLEDGGTAKELYDLKKMISENPNHRLYNNYIIGHKGILSFRFSEKISGKGTNNIRIRGNSTQEYDQNNVIYAFREIRDYFGDRNKLYKKILLLGILQSGVSSSSISFTSLLPYEDFADIYYDAISELIDTANVSNFVNIEAFQRNNWNDDAIVDWMRASFAKTRMGPRYNPAMEFLPKKVKEAVSDGKIPPVIRLYKNQARDYVVYTWEKYQELLTEENKKKYGDGRRGEIVSRIKADMRKNGDTSYINRALFVKVKNEYGNPFVSSYKSRGEVVEQYVYKAINGWGDGYRANEYYKKATQSVIDNGFMKIEEVSDDKIMEVFEGDRRVNRRNAPKGFPETKIPNEIC